MERKISAAALGGVVLLFLSCEAVFTTSLFEWAQRDPSKLSASGKVAYGQDALASGDRKAMARAYEALKDTGDTGLYPFVAELALGAAGVTQALRDLLGNIAAGTDQAGIHAALEAAFASFGPGDLALIQEAAVLIQDAEADAVTISADQYFIAGLGLLVVALDDAGGDAGAIDVSSGPGQTAIAFLTSAVGLLVPGSEAEGLLNDLIGYFP